MFIYSFLLVLLAVGSASASPFKDRRSDIWSRQSNANVSNSTTTPSAGCGANTTWQFDAGGHDNVTMGNRSFLVHIPTDYNASTPHAMVISYHGFKENDNNQETISQFSEEGLTLNGRVNSDIQSRICLT